MYKLSRVWTESALKSTLNIYGIIPLFSNEASTVPIQSRPRTVLYELVFAARSTKQTKTSGAGTVIREINKSSTGHERMGPWARSGSSERTVVLHSYSVCFFSNNQTLCIPPPLLRGLGSAFNVTAINHNKIFEAQRSSLRNPTKTKTVDAVQFPAHVKAISAAHKNLLQSVKFAAVQLILTQKMTLMWTCESAGVLPPFTARDEEHTADAFTQVDKCISDRIFCGAESRPQKRQHDD
ncbi:hypothetical protein JOB18_048764 [Solea senegalensis]|uniref:Uncharacterized protein n=1 Tax=Solea senegalensis TaxID=28829 RepID=A0AAV6PBB9_SOLSE|nr:hypothetical protein JOB18_048764 [Solea senegalensis]